MKTNTAMFDEYLVDVLVTLYQQFPLITHLDTQMITGHDQLDKNGNALDPYGYPSKEVEVCSATIQWLIDHGYIRISVYSGYQFCGSLLTLKTLDALQSPSEDIYSDRTLGDDLMIAFKDGASNVAASVARRILRTRVYD
jgi:hypothetical protein